ncbi:ParA family protein [Pseudoflavonifractor phocaeensis]|uniref:ParA family protein n=1 Tax=Pseudoflavonifractor phocaeensis TaxID=1870988 RepID=UPI00210C13A7|nr:ParA family protein [Pseudoflavonifractor phocaeensis]MCQ4862673.1 ParA family protein [Pseudoflavonifractor phocaeensis]
MALLNFKRGGMLPGRTAPAPEVPAPTGGMLAVWGSPGSGKTTTAVKLAQTLSDAGHNTLLLFCDATTPMLPCVIPPTELEAPRSLRSILAATAATGPLVRNNCNTLKHHSRLTVVGLLKGENDYSFPLYSEEQARGILACLREVAPFVVVDCSSNISNDVLSAAALMDADAVLRLSGCDLKAVSYFSSQLPYMADARWRLDEHYKALSDLRPQHAADQVSAALGGTAFTLPHSEELWEQFLAGDLLPPLALKDSRPYRQALKSILKEVFGV